MNNPLLVSRTAAALATVLLALTACGSPPEVLTGHLQDDGLRYNGLHYLASPSGQSGVVDGNAFRYAAGDRVTFLLGGFPMGNAPGQPVLTFTDITTEDIAGAGRRENYAGALRAMLLSLDEDGDSSNGIDVAVAGQTLFSGLVMAGDAVNTLRRELALVGAPEPALALLP